MLPPKLYVEVWPEESGRETLIHFERVGYGVDCVTGATSEIHVYRLEPAKKRKRKAKP